MSFIGQPGGRAFSRTTIFGRIGFAGISSTFATVIRGVLLLDYVTSIPDVVISTVVLAVNSENEDGSSSTICT